MTGTAANRAKFLQCIDWLGAVSKPRDLALIFIRTRGIYADLNAGGKNYLALSGTKAHSAAETGVEMRGFVDTVLRKVHSKAIAIIVDTDFGGNVLDMAPPGQPSMPELPDENVFPSGHTLVVVCSSDTAQICWESERLKNSVFTYSLLQALSEQGTGGALLEAQKQPPSDKHFLSDYGYPHGSTPGWIRVGVEQDGKPLDGEELWSGAIFELYNIRGGPQSMKFDAEVSSIKVTREEYIRASACIEFQAELRHRNFYRTKVKGRR